MYQCTAGLTSQEVHAAKESFLDKMCNQVHSSRDSSGMPCRYLQTLRDVSGSKLDSHQFWICFQIAHWRNSCSSPCPQKEKTKARKWTDLHTSLHQLASITWCKQILKPVLCIIFFPLFLKTPKPAQKFFNLLHMYNPGLEITAVKSFTHLLLEISCFLH